MEQADQVRANLALHIPLDVVRVGGSVCPDGSWERRDSDGIEFLVSEGIRDKEEQYARYLATPVGVHHWPSAVGILAAFLYQVTLLVAGEDCHCY